MQIPIKKIIIYISFALVAFLFAWFLRGCEVDDLSERAKQYLRDYQQTASRVVGLEKCIDNFEQYTGKLERDINGLRVDYTELTKTNQRLREYEKQLESILTRSENGIRVIENGFNEIEGIIQRVQSRGAEEDN